MLISIKGSVDTSSILAAFVRLTRTDYRSVFKQLRPKMHADQRDHRDRTRGPVSPWKPLAATTLERRARMGIRRNRRILATLPNARRTKISSDAIVMSSPVKWSMAHQDGPTTVGHGAVIPQRQYFWLSRGFMTEASREFKRALWARFLGRKYP